MSLDPLALEPRHSVRVVGVRYRDVATLPNPAGATTVLPSGAAVPVLTLKPSS